LVFRVNSTPKIELDIVYYPRETRPATASGELLAEDRAALATAPTVDDDRDRYRAAALWIARQGALGGLTVSISLIDDDAIRAVNRDELGHDWATDVISFVYDMEIKAGLTHVDGEVLASYDTAQRLADAAGWSPADELLLYVIHGMLHLAGFDDIETRDRQRMREAEQECLIALRVPGAEQHLSRFERVSY
jgi:probable rRNA maturation factor